MASYRFVTDVRFGAPITAVYAAIVVPEGWLGGWGDAVMVQRSSPGDADGVGARFDATVRAPIGYRLSARIETIAVRPPTSLRMRATGDLEGTGVWELRAHPVGTDVRFTWQVRTTARWMNLLAPLARPLFTWSHGVVMRNACEAVAIHLDAPLVAFRSRPAGRPGRVRRVAAAVAHRRAASRRWGRPVRPGRR